MATSMKLGEALCACAERFPARTALLFQGKVRTYSDLIGAAAGRALLLAECGAVPASRVAVYLERGPDLVISLMAAALAGTTQLAIDPEDPPARVQRMLADATPQVLVTQSSLLPRLGEAVAGREIILVDRVPRERQEIQPTPGHPCDPAYMVYTSGSTGEPKASLIPHSALLSRLRWLQSRYRLADDDKVLLKTACGFDVFVAELYWPLTSGAVLVVAPPGAQRDPDYLARAVRDEGVTTLHFVPTLLDLFLAGRDVRERYDGLRRVLAGGEPLTPELTRRFYARSSGTLHNLYGPSECAIYSTAWECPRDPDLPRVLIGGAVDGAELWILDQAQRPVPRGTAGELYIGGDGVGTGYHARPDLTAERFLTLMLEGERRRVYRTGDLVRDVGRRQLEYLGRADTQIKIRGYRVEPGEVEITILRTGLARAAAVVPDFTGAISRLVAFVVPPEPSPGGDLGDRILMALRRELPAYMVPGAVAVVGGLPLSANGKVDRNDLIRQAAGIRPPTSGSAPALLTSAAGVMAARLWREHLGVEAVGESDDFFRLGGDSMAAVQVARELASELHYSIPARALFDSPTFGEFINYVATLGTGEEAQAR
jgi:amino acid adenylation domain-containing protein